MCNNVRKALNTNYRIKYGYVLSNKKM